MDQGQVDGQARPNDREVLMHVCSNHFHQSLKLPGVGLHSSDDATNSTSLQSMLPHDLIALSRGPFIAMRCTA